MRVCEIVEIVEIVNRFVISTHQNLGVLHLDWLPLCFHVPPPFSFMSKFFFVLQRLAQSVLSLCPLSLLSLYLSWDRVYELYGIYDAQCYLLIAKARTKISTLKHFREFRVVFGRLNPGRTCSSRRLLFANPTTFFCSADRASEGSFQYLERLYIDIRSVFTRSSMMGANEYAWKRRAAIPGFPRSPSKVS